MRKRLLIAATVALAALVLAAPAALAASIAAQQSAPGEDNLGYLLAGTLLTWAGFFAYAVYLWRKNRNLHREVEELRRQASEQE